MAVSAWLRPPRRVLSLLIGVTILLGATLSWLGWRLLQQDRALEAQQLRGRLEDAADQIAATLRFSLDAAADSMARLASLPAGEQRAAAARIADSIAADAVVLLLSRDGVEALPPRLLPYHPVSRAAGDAPPGTFARAESLEFRARNLAGAAVALQTLAHAPATAVRAGALVRLGRVLRKAGRLDPALAVYDALAGEGSLAIEGLPAELLARSARLSVLEASGRRAQAVAEADSAYSGLLSGRWAVTAGGFAFYAQALARWLPPQRAAQLDSAAAPALALAGAADSLWTMWRAADAAGAFDGQRNLRLGSRPVFMLWRGGGARAVALIAGRSHLERLLLGWIGPLLEREGARVALADAEGRLLVGGTWDPSQPQALRTSSETELPWTLRVATADLGAARTHLAGRRRLVLLGLATAALIVLIGLYAVTRAVSREIEVARLKSDFVSAVSHEFRTPLTTLRQLTELLAGGRVVSEERRAIYYDTLKREGERLHRLVEGLLDFGRMEAGALEFRFESVEAAGLVRQVVEEFQREVQAKGYPVALIAMNGECPVRADREALGRAVWNLLDNAVKYSPDDRAVTVKVSRGDGAVVIRVQDRGVGIPAEEQGRIFEKFVRGSGSGTRAVKGTGIGLAMVRHIVTAHGGEVRVESAKGAGSTFIISLPTGEAS